MFQKLISDLLDPYERKARLTPGLILASPVLVAIIALGYWSNLLANAALAAAVFSVAAYPLANLIGDLGRKSQTALWDRWGGAPMTQLLRLRDTAATDAEKTLWRQALQAETKVTLLSRRAEASNPAKGDEAIGAALGPVLYLGRAGGDGIVIAENAAYGYARNLYGARWYGRGISMACLALLVTLRFRPIPQVTDSIPLWSIVLMTVLLAVWIIYPSERRAKEAGFRYGRQLLQAVARKRAGTAD